MDIKDIVEVFVKLESDSLQKNQTNEDRHNNVNSHENSIKFNYLHINIDDLSKVKSDEFIDLTHEFNLNSKNYLSVIVEIPEKKDLLNLSIFHHLVTKSLESEGFQYLVGYIEPSDDDFLNPSYFNPNKQLEFFSQ